jgi:hypothetical protein
LRDYLDADPEKMDIYNTKARYIKQAQVVKAGGASSTNHSLSNTARYTLKGTTAPSRFAVPSPIDTLKLKSTHDLKIETATTTYPTQITLQGDDVSLNQTSVRDTMRDRGSPILVP